MFVILPTDAKHETLCQQIKDVTPQGCKLNSPLFCSLFFSTLLNLLQHFFGLFIIVLLKV